MHSSPHTRNRHTWLAINPHAPVIRIFFFSVLSPNWWPPKDDMVVVCSLPVFARTTFGIDFLFQTQTQTLEFYGTLKSVRRQESLHSSWLRNSARAAVLPRLAATRVAWPQVANLAMTSCWQRSMWTLEALIKHHLAHTESERVLSSQHYSGV